MENEPSDGESEPVAAAADPTRAPQDRPIAQPFRPRLSPENNPTAFAFAPEAADPEPTHRRMWSVDDEAASGTTTRKVRLPLLSSDDPTQVTFVGTAYVRNGPATDETPTAAGFEEYFTYQSLFSATPTDTFEDDEPYRVLGIRPDLPWPQVVKAHRALVKANHPDHLTDSSEEERAAAEARLRAITAAYRELTRRQGGREA